MLDPAVLAETAFFRRFQHTDAAVLALLRQLRDELRTATQPHLHRLPPFVDAQTGRISQGNHYRLAAGYAVPYRVLDFPRWFAGGEWFALRSLLLWGQHWSLHLSTTVPEVRQQLAEQHATLAEQGWELATADDPWVWERAPAGCIPVSELTEAAFRAQLERLPYTRLVRHWPADQPHPFAHDAVQAWAALVPLLGGGPISRSVMARS